MIFFTADEHFGHANIIKFCNRPFAGADEMDAEIIRRHNERVTKDDFVIHAGDFTFKNPQKYVDQLNGQHLFLQGNHDKWNGNGPILVERTIDGQAIVVCHYAMRVWPKSHFGSWQLYGHTHGRLPPKGKQYDVGVDNNDFYPVSFARIKEILATLPDNENQLKPEEIRKDAK